MVHLSPTASLVISSHSPHQTWCFKSIKKAHVSPVCLHNSKNTLLQLMLCQLLYTHLIAWIGIELNFNYQARLVKFFVKIESIYPSHLFEVYRNMKSYWIWDNTPCIYIYVLDLNTPETKFVSFWWRGALEGRRRSGKPLYSSSPFELLGNYLT